MVEQDESTPVALALSAKHIPFRLFRHPGPVRSLEQAARERGQQQDQVIRSILFRLAKGEYAMVLIAGKRQVSWRALRHYLGQSRLTMAREAEVLSVTGYELGAVAPFGLPSPLRILVDQNVAGQKGEISIGSGVRGTTVILHAHDLLRALGEVEIGQFGEDD
jgi:Cys-tRNA(Pro) deacylase